MADILNPTRVDAASIAATRRGEYALARMSLSYDVYVSARAHVRDRRLVARDVRALVEERANEATNVRRTLGPADPHFLKALSAYNDAVVQSIAADAAADAAAVVFHMLTGFHVD